MAVVKTIQHQYGIIQICDDEYRDKTPAELDAVRAEITAVCDQIVRNKILRELGRTGA